MTLALTLLGGLVAASVALYAGLLQLDVRPRLALAPGYALIAADGARLTSEDLRGHVVLYTFDYLGNDDPARRTAPLMREVQAALRAQPMPEVPVRLVTVAFNHPPPDSLQAAAARTEAAPDLWTWATGSPQALRTVVRDGFGVYYERRPEGGYRFDPVFVVVDGLGIVRARYRIGRPSAAALVSDLRAVAREASATRGSTRLAYEAAHLFSCYSVR